MGKKSKKPRTQAPKPAVSTSQDESKQDMGDQAPTARYEMLTEAMAKKLALLICQERFDLARNDPSFPAAPELEDWEATLAEPQFDAYREEAREEAERIVNEDPFNIAKKEKSMLDSFARGETDGLTVVGLSVGDDPAAQGAAQLTSLLRGALQLSDDDVREIEDSFRTKNWVPVAPPADSDPSL